jgi:hypothetical protein
MMVEVIIKFYFLHELVNFVITKTDDLKRQYKCPMTINKEWHLRNKMPKNATFEQRVQWHIKHNKNCSCRPGFPKKLEEEMKKRGMKSEFES